MELDAFKHDLFLKYSALKRLLPCFLIILTNVAARSEPPGTEFDPILSNAINSELQRTELRAGWQGVMIMRLSDSKILYEHDAHHVFLPASNNKILTSAAALEILGKDFKYKTRLCAASKVSQNGVLHGNLVLIGSGDPLLSPNNLKEIAQRVRKSGIRKITGALYYDDLLFDRQRYGDTWAWDDMDFYYSAQISALNINENMIFIQPHPGKSNGYPLRFDVGPVTGYVQIKNTATTGSAGSKSSLNITRLPGLNTILISGSIPVDIKPDKNLPVGVTVENPSRYAAYMLQKYLLADGVHIRQNIFEAQSPLLSPIIIAEHVSEPLSALLRRLNKPSDNLMAECLLKTVGAKMNKQGTGGETGTGAQAARDLFKKIGLDMSELNQSDGSGLSRTNYVSPSNILKLLAELSTRPDFPVFYNSLPIAGVDGTLKNRMKGTAAEKNCHAKTGYVSHASSLSGYVTSKDGILLGFSILMNNHLCPNKICTQTQDHIIDLLANYTFEHK